MKEWLYGPSNQSELIVKSYVFYSFKLPLNLIKNMILFYKKDEMNLPKNPTDAFDKKMQRLRYLSQSLMNVAKVIRSSSSTSTAKEELSKSSFDLSLKEDYDTSCNFFKKSSDTFDNTGK
jgi:hypothetical protein